MNAQQKKTLTAIKDNIRIIISLTLLDEDRQIDFPHDDNDIEKLLSAIDDMAMMISELFKEIERHEVSAIFYRFLLKNIPKLSSENLKFPIVLSDLFGEEKIESFSEGLIDFLGKLPLTYKINFPIPLFHGDFKIEKNIINLSCWFPATAQLKKTQPWKLNIMLILTEKDFLSC